MQQVEAKIGRWYQVPNGQAFEVVALDDEGSIEIQYFEGEVEELEDEIWAEMFLSEVCPPEDWTGAYDKIDREDLGYSDIEPRRESWSSTLRALEVSD